MANYETRYKIFEKNKISFEEARNKSRTWFEQQIRLIQRKRYTAPQLMRDDPRALRSRVLIGKMYMFAYDPKTKMDLPYYDRFPLIFVIEYESNGFIGLNLHYLPYDLRFRLLDRLSSLASNQDMDESTRLKISWDILKSASRYRLAKPCVKRYLTGHVKSQFKEISAENWVTAMMLPVERFRKAPAQEVWAESRKKI